MDLNTLNTELNLGEIAERGAVLTLMDPRKEESEPLLSASGEPVTITLLGSDSTTYERESQRAAQDRKSIKIKGRGVQIDMAKMSAERLALLAVCTKAWTFEEDGKPYPCTPANARKLYGKHKWMRDQVSAFVEERANFLGEA